MTTGFFVTGTDTGVGKTVVACALLRAYAARGLRAVGMKPVATGIAHSGRQRRRGRARGRRQRRCPRGRRNPYAFAPAIAPHLAARRSRRARSSSRASTPPTRARAVRRSRRRRRRGRRVCPARTTSTTCSTSLRRSACRCCSSSACAWAVSIMRLLSALAIRARGLMLAGWVANAIEPGLPRFAENVATLEHALPRRGSRRCAWSASGMPAVGSAQSPI